MSFGDVKFIRGLCALLALVCMGLSSAAQAATPAAPGTARAGIQKTIDETNVLLKRGASAQEIADVMYEPDLMIIGEGEKSLYRDLKSFMGPLATYVADGTRCNLSIVDPIRASGNLAVAFIFEHCAAAKAGDKDEDARILYVFREGAKGWRVTMEMFGWGIF
jgi:hypothetical protein